MKKILVLASVALLLGSFSAHADEKLSDGSNLCKISLRNLAEAITSERTAYMSLVENKDDARTEQRKTALNEAVQNTQSAFKSIARTCVD